MCHSPVSQKRVKSVRISEEGDEGVKRWTGERNEMNVDLGHDSALLRLYWAVYNLD